MCFKDIWSDMFVRLLSLDRLQVRTVLEIQLDSLSGMSLNPLAIHCFLEARAKKTLSSLVPETDFKVIL